MSACSNASELHFMSQSLGCTGDPTKGSQQSLCQVAHERMGAWIDCLGAVCSNQVSRDAPLSISACRMLPCRTQCCRDSANLSTRTTSASGCLRMDHTNTVYNNLRVTRFSSYNGTGNLAWFMSSSSDCVLCPWHRLHGKNRLGGNSLLECVVFGRIAGREAAAHVLHVYEQQQYQGNSGGQR